jgi:hypothetical protein
MQKPVFGEIHFDEFVTYKMKSPEERKYLHFAEINSTSTSYAEEINNVGV